MKRLIMTAAMLLTLALGFGEVRSVSAQDDPMCADFDTYAEAYAAFEEAGGPPEDPFDFDTDGDGYPCEDVADAPDQAQDAPEGAWPRSSAEAPAESSTEPSVEPSVESSAGPSAEPSDEPSAEPSDEPSVEPSDEPSAEPSDEPSIEPTETVEASASPSDVGGMTTDPSMPITGSGPLGTDSTSLMTMLLALFAVIAGAIGTLSLVRSRRS